MNITFKILRAQGNNVTVLYTCGADSVVHGLDVPADATQAEIVELCNSSAPIHYFETLRTLVPTDALASIVGLSGYVPPPQAAVDLPALEVEVPEEVTRYQLIQALQQAGLSEVVSRFMEAPTTPEIQRAEWENATSYKRVSPSIIVVTQLLGLSEVQMDALFVTAAGYIV